MLLHPFLPHGFYCEHLWMRISILAGGGVEPCSCANSKMPALEAAPGHYHEVWNSPLFQRTRRFSAKAARQAPAGGGDIWDCCANCPVAPKQRFQTPREYYGHLARLASDRRTPYRAQKLSNLRRLLRESEAGADVVSAYPAWANIALANTCNLRCPECVVGRRELPQAAANMTPERFAAILEELGPSLIFMELYRYGEPLLNRRAPEMIELATRKYGIACRVSTNFSMTLDDDRIDALARSGLAELVVAADDIEQERYITYRRGGEIDVVEDNLRRLAARRRELGLRHPRILWQSLRFRFNQDRADEIRRRALSLGADRFVMLPAYISAAHPELLPTDAGRRGRRAADKRPRLIISASASPGITADRVPTVRLEAVIHNDLAWDRIPAEAPGDLHPIRIGIKMIDAGGAIVGELGRIHLDRPVERGRSVTFGAIIPLPRGPARYAALRFDLVAEGAYWFEDQMDIQSLPFDLKLGSSE